MGLSWCSRKFAHLELNNNHSLTQGPSLLWLYGSWIYNHICNQCLSPLILWVRFMIRARRAALYDKVCQWLATGGWFSPGPPVSATNKTDRHDITEILLKVALNTIKTNKFTHLTTTLIRPLLLQHQRRKGKERRRISWQ